LKVGHENERAAIVRQLEKQYRRWFQLLRAGFNVLLYGFGSKKALLEDFEKRFCVDGGVIVVNGFFPSLKPKQVLVAAAAALSGQDASQGGTSGANDANSKVESATTESLLAQIASATKGSRDAKPKRLYIVLHNIDGSQLRSSEAQALLGELASMDRVHLIASIDHVNAPLLWSKREAARFNWVWQEAATFAPYALETANLPQLLASKGEERHVRGAANVLRSLTSNGRAIFRLLAEHQLDNQDSQGMPLDMFYAACREQFLVSSEVTLRVHLTEFTDHELVRSSRGRDGRDLLSIPLNADALKELLASFD
jgi:origin recognition complex subunit 2